MARRINGPDMASLGVSEGIDDSSLALKDAKTDFTPAEAAALTIGDAWLSPLLMIAAISEKKASCPGRQTVGLRSSMTRGSEPNEVSTDPRFGSALLMSGR